MLPHDISTADALAQLSQPDDDPAGWSRRRFLQAMALGLGGAGVISAADAMGVRTGLPRWLQEAWSAPPVLPSEGILVNVVMYGGNDGLNTLVPMSGAQQSKYLQYRGGLAVRNALALGNSGYGLHPNLAFLKSLYDRSNVAVVQGVGYANPDFSHFNSMAVWMRGLANASGPPTTGWIGRWLDGVSGFDAFRAATIGTSVPLHLIGQSRRATGIPVEANAFGTGAKTSDVRMFDGLRHYASAPAGRGPFHDSMAQAVKTQIDVARTVNPLLNLASSTNPIVQKMTLAARLINADLGLRVIDVGWGDFDSHGQQAQMHPVRLAEFDAALRQFFLNLDDRFRSRVTILTMSEFGRTPYANDSAGTDHGAASCQFLIGTGVKGGLYGAYPSLAGLSRWDDLQATVDFRSVFSAVLDGWMGGDGTAITNTAPLAGLFRVGPGEGVATGAAPAAAPSGYTSITPVRVLDTRLGTGNWRRLPAGDRTTVEVDALKTAGVASAGVTAVALNLAAVLPTRQGYFTVWPTAEPRPYASSVNFLPSTVVPNLVISKVGASSRVNVFNSLGQTHVVADLVGTFSEGAGKRLVPISPFRLFDTRTGKGTAKGAIGAGKTINVSVVGVPGSGVPATGVDSVVLNVAVTQPTAWSYLTVWPTGVARPVASSLNMTVGQTVSNLVIAKVGTGGRVSFYNNAGTTHVVGDVVGYFAAGGGQYVPVTASRLLDTRLGQGAPKAKVGPAGMDLQVLGVGGVPSSGVKAVMFNVAVVAPSTTGWVTVWPSGEAVPGTANLNYVANLTVANAVLCKVGTNGKVRFRCAAAADLVADVVGYFA